MAGMDVCFDFGCCGVFDVVCVLKSITNGKQNSKNIGFTKSLYGFTIRHTNVEPSVTQGCSTTSIGTIFQRPNHWFETITFNFKQLQNITFWLRSCSDYLSWQETSDCAAFLKARFFKFFIIILKSSKRFTRKEFRRSKHFPPSEFL